MEVQQKVELLEALVKELEEYLELLKKLERQNFGFLYAHGIEVDKEDVEAGRRQREKIFDLKQKLKDGEYNDRTE